MWTHRTEEWNRKLCACFNDLGQFFDGLTLAGEPDDVLRAAASAIGIMERFLYAIWAFRDRDFDDTIALTDIKFMFPINMGTFHDRLPGDIAMFVGDLFLFHACASDNAIEAGFALRMTIKEFTRDLEACLNRTGSERRKRRAGRHETLWRWIKPDSKLTATQKTRISAAVSEIANAYAAKNAT